MVRAKFPDAFLNDAVVYGDAVLTIDPAKWIGVATWLAVEGGFTFLSDLCALDLLGAEPRFQVVYNLTDINFPRRLTVVMPVPDGAPPNAPSVTSIWPTASFQEREAFDMFGIVFEGHPNLTRILMPDEWEGHPLRKDYAIGKIPIEFKHLSPGY